MTVELIQVIRGAGFAALLTAAPLAAQQTSPVQALYTGAEAKEAAGDHAGALADFTAMEARLSGQPASPNLALARIGQARMLIALARPDEAADALDAAVGGGGLDRPALIEQRIEALQIRSALRYSGLDHVGAAADYLTLGEIAPDAVRRLSALTAAARAQIFVQPAAAPATFARAEALVPQVADLSKDDRSSIEALRGRILLNAGDAAGAERAFKEAVRLRGGLTPSGTIAEFAIRSDAALANLRLGRQEEARRFLAFSGAGMAARGMPRPGGLTLPPCGVDGTEPDDRVVVEFGIADDGTVAYAQPIASTRPGAHALAYARVVRDWRYPPDAVARMPLYFRHGSRVELACTTRSARPTELAAILDAYGTWYGGLGLPTPSPETFESERAGRAHLAAPGRTPRERFAAFEWLTWFAGSHAARHEAWQQAVTIMDTLSPSPGARVAFLLREPTRSDREQSVSKIRVLADPTVAGDPALRSAVALTHARGLDDDAARLPVLQRVADDPDQSDRDPLKVAALIDLANIHARAGRPQEAETAYARTGLTAQQCALLDGTQRMRRLGNTVFPPEAQRWGFDGWTSVEFDVSADGRTQQVRTVAAYPPAVFSDAARTGVQGTRYEIAYRPGGDPGCTGASLNFVFNGGN